jgi:hypothetical protein
MKTLTIEKLKPEARNLYLFVPRRVKSYSIKVSKSDLIDAMKMVRIDRIKIWSENDMDILFKL